MKILVIGANGNLGKHATKIALDRGHEVHAMVITKDGVDNRASLIEKDLFSLTREEASEYDAIISCFGSGFNSDPVINKNVCEFYCNLLAGTSTKLVHIIGSGSLYSDESKTIRVYERPNHPDFLKGISMNATLGLNILLESKDVKFTVVMPSVKFENVEGTGKYIVGTDLVPLKNENGESYSRYYDLATAMVDVIENDTYNHQAITILSVL